LVLVPDAPLKHFSVKVCPWVVTVVSSAFDRVTPGWPGREEAPHAATIPAPKVTTSSPAPNART